MVTSVPPASASTPGSSSVNAPSKPQTPFVFKHPGTFMSPDMTKCLKHDVESNPNLRKAMEKLVKETPQNYKPQALAKVDVNWNGVGTGHKECTDDGKMAVAGALLYWATGDRKWADMSLSILRAWAEINTVFIGNNAPLEAAWSVCSMARAAELLKHAPEQNIATMWKGIEPKFFAWLDKTIMPLLKDAKLWSYTQMNNWHLSMLCARMQIAILREDRQEWDWCIKQYPILFKRVQVCDRCPGEITDGPRMRDSTHQMFAIGGMVQAPEMAWHQGVDLYDRCIVDCVELIAAIMLKEVPPQFKPEELHFPYGYWCEPVFEIARAHFTERLRIAMPKTVALTDKLGPDRVTFHWGPNYLTHRGRCAGQKP